MNRTIHSIETAPEASRPLLEGVTQKLGFVPNLFGGLAAAPPVLEAYLGLAAAYGKTSLTPTEQQVVALSISLANGCDYCMAAHTTMAQGAGVNNDVLESLRNNTPLADPKLEALRHFALKMLDTRGHLEPGDLDHFIQAGFTETQAYEVIVGIALKVISNFSNRLLSPDLDQAFEANRWQKPLCEEACTCSA